MSKETKLSAVWTNERFYTGALCDALSMVTEPNFCVLHQTCIGEGFTHSALSGRYYLHGEYRSTLLVGEAKKNEEDDIVPKSRGQLFNELIRHRAVDKGRTKKTSHRPILLLSFNSSYLSLELAFPSIKGGKMEEDGWVAFAKSVNRGTETYWTIQVAFVCINGDDEGVKQKLARVLRFISDTMKYLDNMGDSVRLETKTPWLEPHDVKCAQKAGENVTIVTMKSGSKMVFKEFCYYLREDDDFNDIPKSVENTGLNYDLVSVDGDDQRKPPPKNLLAALGEPYEAWKVREYAGGLIKILEYNFIEGGNWPSSTKGWIMVLKQIETVHSLGLVHGDLLPRNIIFSGETGNVIDFDLMRLEIHLTYPDIIRRLLPTAMSMPKPERT